MPIYQYKAKKNAGKIVKGLLLSATPKMLEQTLNEAQLLLVSAKERTKASEFLMRFYGRRTRISRTSKMSAIFQRFAHSRV